jgi:uncharacterized Zn-binding protein involved in type VI secretion
MSKATARKGDTSDHGGTIVGNCSPTLRADGKAVARSGDMHSCPVNGHGTTALTGTTLIVCEGHKVVQVGDTAGCGAKITVGSPTMRNG